MGKQHLKFAVKAEVQTFLRSLGGFRSDEFCCDLIIFTFVKSKNIHEKSKQKEAHHW